MKKEPMQLYISSFLRKLRVDVPTQIFIRLIHSHLYSPIISPVPEGTGSQDGQEKRRYILCRSSTLTLCLGWV